MRLQQSRFIAALTAPVLALGIGAMAAGADEKPAPAAKEPPNGQSAAEAKAQGGPRMSIEKETVDLGEVLKGSTASAAFEIRNTGDQVLKILDARPG